MNAAMLLTALFSLSTSPLWVRWADASIALIGSWRLLGASLLLSLPLLFHGPQKLIWSHRPEAFASLGAGLFFFLHLWTYVLSAQTTTISHLVIIFSAAPLFTAIGARLFFRESFPRRLYAVCGLAGVGIALIFQDPVVASSARAISSSFEGDLAALISAFFHSGYSLCGKKARQTAPNLRFTFWLYMTAGLLFAMVAWGQEAHSPSTWNFYGGIAGLILFPTFLGHSLYAYLLKTMNINVLSCSKLLEPAFASGLAFFLFQEEIHLVTLIGFFLIGGALLILFNPFHYRKMRSELKKTPPT